MYCMFSGTMMSFCLEDIFFNRFLEVSFGGNDSEKKKYAVNIMLRCQDWKYLMCCVLLEAGFQTNFFFTTVPELSWNSRAAKSLNPPLLSTF